VCFQVTPENVKTQSWVTKTVWQRIPGRQAHNSETPTTITVHSIPRNDHLPLTGGPQVLTSPPSSNCVNSTIIRVGCVRLWMSSSFCVQRSCFSPRKQQKRTPESFDVNNYAITIWLTERTTVYNIDRNTRRETHTRAHTRVNVNTISGTVPCTCFSRHCTVAGDFPAQLLKTFLFRRFYPALTRLLQRQCFPGAIPW